MKLLRLYMVVPALALSIICAAFCWAGSQTASSTNASVIIDRVEALFNDTGNAFLDATEMLVWVNQGIMDICAKTHCLEAIEIESIVAGTQSYSIADPFIVVKAVAYNDEGLKRLSVGQFFALKKQTGTPKHWMLWENKVYVHPTPGVALTSGLDVYTIKRPSTVASDAAVLVPAQYDNALILYVYMQALIKDSLFNKAAQIEAQYAAELDRFRVDLVQPETTVAQ